MANNINGGKITFGIGYQVDESGLRTLKKNLEEVRQLSASSANFKGMKIDTKELIAAKQTARDVSNALERAFNPKLNTYNINKFTKELNNMGVDKIARDFKSLGPAGTSAFRQLTASVATTGKEIKKSHKLLDEWGDTLGKTLKWNISSSIINGFTGQIQQAYGFTKNLDRSLNDIRIVTGKSADEMERFAKQATKAAKDLGASTVDYTDASLIYYQQGLSDSDVKARTNTTLKAANVTGQSTSQVSEELTAVWNGYKIAADQTETAVDKLAAVAATSASDLEELSTGISKVASAANNMGVDLDQLTAMISTTISVTREAPETIGTTYKTIFSRMADLKMGGSDEEGVTLGKVSGGLANYGINLLDETGELRNMGTVIEEVATKWDTWTKSQQTAVAELAAGNRQYSRFMALFDNWDMYEKALETSKNSGGTLEKQNEIYLDSMEAKLQQYSTSQEAIWNKMFKADAFKGFVEAGTVLNTFLGQFIDSIGGGGAAITALGGIATKVFSKQIAESIQTTITNLKAARTETQNLNDQQKFLEKAKEITKRSESQDPIVQEIASRYEAINKYSHLMNKEQLDSSNEAIQGYAGAMDALDIYKKKMSEAAEVAKAFNEAFGKPTRSQQFQENLDLTKEKGGIQNIGGQTPSLETFESKGKEALDSELNGLNEIIIGIQDDIKQINEYVRQRGIVQGQITKTSDEIKNLTDEDITKAQMRQDELKSQKSLSKEEAAELKEIEKKIAAYEKYKQQLKEVERLTRQITNTSKKGIDVSKLNTSIKKLVDGKVLNETSTEYKKLTDAIETYNKALKNGNPTEVRNAMKQLGVAIQDVSKVSKEAGEELFKVIHDSNTGKTENTFQQLKSQVDLYKQQIKDLENELQKLDTTRAFVNMAGGIQQVISAVTTLQHLGSIWNNDDLTSGEKILQTIQNLAFALPQLFTGLQTLNTSWNTVTSSVKLHMQVAKTKLLQYKEEATMQAHTTAEKIKAIAAEKAKAASAKTEAAAEGEEIVVSQGVAASTNTETASHLAGAAAKITESGAAITLRVALHGLKSAVSSLLTAIGPVGWVIGIIAGAIAITTAVIEGMDSAEKQQKRLNEATEEYAKNLDKASKNIETINELADAYDSAADSLKELIRGTDQWNEGLDKVNDSVQALVEAFPNLKEKAYFDGEKWVVDDADIAAAKKELEQSQRTATFLHAAAESREKDILTGTGTAHLKILLDGIDDDDGTILNRLMDYGQNNASTLEVQEYLSNTKKFTVDGVSDILDAYQDYLKVVSQQSANRSAVGFDIASNVYKGDIDSNFIASLYSKAYGANDFLFEDLPGYLQQAIKDHTDDNGKKREILQAIGDLDYNDNIYYNEAQGVLIQKNDDDTETILHKDDTVDELIAYFGQYTKYVQIDTAIKQADDENLKGIDRKVAIVQNLIEQGLPIDLSSFSNEALEKLDIDNAPQSIQDEVNEQKKKNNAAATDFQSKDTYSLIESDTLKKGIYSSTELETILKLEDKLNGLDQESVRDIFNDNVAQDKILNVLTLISQTDFTKWNDVQNLQKAFNELGVGIDVTSEAFQKYIKITQAGVAASEDYVDVFKEQQANLTKFNSIVDSLTVGESEITEEQYEWLKQFVDPEVLKKKFGDGSYEFDKKTNTITKKYKYIEQIEVGDTQIFYTDKETLDAGLQEQKEIATNLKLDEDVQKFKDNYSFFDQNGFKWFDVSAIENALAQIGYTYEDLETKWDEIYPKLKAYKEKYDDILDEQQSMDESYISTSVKSFNQLYRDRMSGIIRSQAAYEAYYDAVLDKDLSTLGESREAFEQYKKDMKAAREDLFFGLTSSGEDDLALRMLAADKRMKAFTKNATTWETDITSGDIQKRATALTEMGKSAAEAANITYDSDFQDFINDDTHRQLVIEVMASGDWDKLNSLRLEFAKEKSKKIYEAVVETNTDEVQDQIDSFLKNLEQEFSNIEAGKGISDNFAKALIQMMEDTDGAGAYISSILESLGLKISNIVSQLWMVENYDLIKKVGYAKSTVGQLRYDEEGKVIGQQTLDDNLKGRLTQEELDTYNSWSDEEKAVASAFAGKITLGGEPLNNILTSESWESFLEKGGVAQMQKVTITPTANLGGGKTSMDTDTDTDTTKSEKNRADKQEENKLKLEEDLYHDINIQIQLVENSLKKLERQKNKFVGQKYLDVLKQENDQLQKQNQNIKDKIAIKEKESQTLKEEIQNTTELAGLKITAAEFGADGELTNYHEFINSIIDQINQANEDVQKAVAAYNEHKNEEDVTTYENAITVAKQKVSLLDEAYKALLEKLEKYEQIINNDIPELEETIADNTDKIIENQIKSFHYAVDIELDLSNAERQWNEFKRKVIDGGDRFSLFGDDLIKKGNTLLANLQSFGNDIPTLAQHVTDITNEVNTITAGGTGAVYGDNQAQAIEDLKKYRDQLMETYESVEDAYQEIVDLYNQMIDKTQEAFSRQIQIYDAVNDVLEHNINIVKKLNGDKNFNAIGKYYDKEITNNLGKLDFLKKEAQFWQEQMEKEDKNSEAWLKARENYLSAQSDLNSAVEASIDTIIAKYQNTVAEIMDDLAQKLTRGMGLDYVNEEWELVNKNADMYLDYVNKAFEIRKLHDKYAKSISESNDPKIQERLTAAMQEQTKYLEKKEKLSKYDVERANLLYEIELKKIALEEAQQNKSQMRLRRDSQGNYSYQFVANQDEIDKAKSELDALQNSLYNLDKEAYRNNLQEIHDLTEEYIQKQTELANDQTLSEEERRERQKLLYDEYQEAINNKTQDNIDIRQNLYESATDELKKTYDQNVYNFEDMINEMVPQLQSGVQAMVDEYIAEGGFGPTVDATIAEIEAAHADYSKSLQDMADAAGISLETIEGGYDTTADAVGRLVDDNDKLIDSWDAQIDKIGALKGEIDGLVKQLEEMQGFLDTIPEANDAIKKATTTTANKGETAPKKIESRRINGTPGPKKEETDPVKKPGDTGGTGDEDTGDTGDTGKKGDTKATLTDDETTRIAGTIMFKFGAGGWGNANDSPDRKDLDNIFEKGAYSAVQTKINEAYLQAYALVGGKDNFKSLSDDEKNRTWRQTDLYKNWNNRNLTRSMAKAGSYDTGGYTGEWGNEGKLAFLHEKEIVLNKDDTKNILAAVNIIRDLSNVISGVEAGVQSRMAAIAAISTPINAVSAVDNSQKLDQNVHIEASFPNVSNSNEIEEAFNNLVNMATQHVYQNKR